MSTFFKVTGKFIGERAIEKVSDTFSKRSIAIDTGASYNSTLVVDLVKSGSKDNLNLASMFEPNQDVTLWVDVVTRKGGNGNWFPSLSCFRIDLFVPQTTQDFGKEPKAEPQNDFPTLDESTQPLPPGSMDDLPF